MAVSRACRWLVWVLAIVLWVSSTVPAAGDTSAPGDAAPEEASDPTVPPEPDTAPDPDATPEQPVSVPVKPSGLTVTAEAGSLGVGLDWGDVDGATYYLVRWRSVDGGGRLNEGVEALSSVTNITVADFGEWVVRVQACNDAGCSQPLARKFKIEPILEPEPTPEPDPGPRPPEPTPEPKPDPGAPASVPVKPSGLTVTAEAGSLGVGLDWGDVDGATNYRVRWRSVESGERLNEGVEVLSSALTIALSGFGEWVVRVEACNDAGCGEPLTRKFKVEPVPEPEPEPRTPDPVPEPQQAPGPRAPVTVPAKPRGLRVSTEAGSLGVGLDWGDVDGATYYLVRWRSVDGGGRLNEGVEASSSVATFTLSSFGEWVVRVQACNDAGCGQPLSRKLKVEPIQEPEFDQEVLPGLVLTVSPDRLVEDGGETSIVVAAAWARGGSRPEDTTVAVSLSGTAEDPEDYTAEVAELVIAAGASVGTATLSITPVDDGVVEGDEIIVVSGAVGTSLSLAAITLADALVTAAQESGTNAAPAFSGPNPTSRSVPENSPAGTSVGDPVTATDADSDDELTYTLTGTDAAAFTIDGSGQIKVAEGATLDYEQDSLRTLDVNVSDGKDANGDPDPAVDHTVGVLIQVTDVKAPLPPVVTATPSADGEGILLDWTQEEAEDRAPVTEYHLRYRELGANPCDDTPRLANQLTFEATARTATLPLVGAPDLEPGVVYCVKLEARSGEGESLGIAQPRTNTAPTSDDVTLSASPPSLLLLSADDFPYTDPHDTLGRVKILSLPDPAQGRLKLGASNVAINQFIDADSLNQFSFAPAETFSGGATFRFQLEDSHGALTEAHTVTINLEIPAITSVEITSGPVLNNTYAAGEPVRVTVTWDQQVNWDITSAGAAISLDLEVGDATRTAALVTGGETTGRAPALTFEYVVQSTDTDPDGLRPVAGAGGDVVQLAGGATVADAAARDAARSYDSLPEDDALHKVDGAKAFNRPPVFPEDDPSPLARTVDENSPAGTVVGAPVAATDPNPGDTLTYELAGSDAAAFTIDGSGQIKVGPDTALDYETKDTYSVTVSVHDSLDPTGAPDTDTDASVDVTITVNDLPEQPRPVTGLTATPVSAYSVRLSWTASDTAGLPPIDRVMIDPYYFEQERREYLPQVVLDPEEATEPAHTVTGLAPETTYYFEVRVRNTDGLQSTLVEAHSTTAANTAPTSADFTKNTHTDTDLSFTASDFPFIDADAGDSLRAVRIVTLPSSGHGTLKWTGSSGSQVPVTADRLIAAADLGLVFVPKTSYEGAAGFTFKVVDMAGAETAAAYTVTVNV